jgi:hypothetical protein
MNERIKELAIQAGFFYEDYKDIWYLEYHNQTCEEEMKKFAELIVKECADLFEIEWGDEKLTGNDVGYVLKKHFGVEE